VARTVILDRFEWDESKDLANLRKHRVAFAEAASALAHRDVKIIEDPTAEGRFIGIGYSRTGRLLTVVHEERGAHERIISAWKATRAERKRYLTPEADEQ
jgi:uncharacterized DUF497 family protein